MQQYGKRKKAMELSVCNRCVEHGFECKLRPGKLTLCTECHKAKAKCEQPSEEKLERKCKQVQAEELEAGPNGLKKLKKILEESNVMTELVEVLRVGLRAIMDALNKQGKLLQELVELGVDKVELMQLDWWVSEDKEDEEDDETEEGEVEVEKELLELAKEREENGDMSEEEEEVEE